MERTPHQPNEFESELTDVFSPGLGKAVPTVVVGSRYENPRMHEISNALNEAERYGAIRSFTAEAGRNYLALYSFLADLHDDTFDGDPAELVAGGVSDENLPAIIVEQVYEGRGKGFVVYFSTQVEEGETIDFDPRQHVEPDAKEYAMIQAAFLGTEIDSGAHPIEIEYDFASDDTELINVEIAAHDAYVAGKIDEEQFTRIKRSIAVARLRRDDPTGLIEFIPDKDNPWYFSKVRFEFPEKDVT